MCVKWMRNIDISEQIDRWRLGDRLETSRGSQSINPYLDRQHQTSKLGQASHPHQQSIDKLCVGSAGVEHALTMWSLGYILL